MSKNIKFTLVFENVADIFYPKPASECIPDWYKKQTSYSDNKKITFLSGRVNSTIKKCIPIFDSITSGYIIFCPFDIQITKKENGYEFIWSQRFLDDFFKTDPVTNLHDPILFHDSSQLLDYPKLQNYGAIPKFISPWSIQTPKGYSILITQPMHRESVFTILDGIVDTDTYKSPVNFPFVFNDPNWEGIIKAGTPIAQIIPFKRDTWKMSFGNKKDFDLARKDVFKNNAFMTNAYKKLFWNKKSFK